MKVDGKLALVFLLCFAWGIHAQEAKKTMKFVGRVTAVEPDSLWTGNGIGCASTLRRRISLCVFEMGYLAASPVQ